jgi:hypothetical protein
MNSRHRYAFPELMGPTIDFSVLQHLTDQDFEKRLGCSRRPRPLRRRASFSATQSTYCSSASDFGQVAIWCIRAVVTPNEPVRLLTNLPSTSLGCCATTFANCRKLAGVQATLAKPLRMRARSRPWLAAQCNG